MNNYDVIIIGGSYAGLSAAMALGRSLRKVLIIDGGKPCNRQTPHSHNFLTQDGETPLAISTKAKAQVLAYPTITFSQDLAVTAQQTNGGFAITTANEKTYLGNKLILTTGVKDIFPAIKGFAECWGISVLHCPYCHGYEVKDENLGIIANGEMAFELCRLIDNWTKDLTLFTNGEPMLTTEQLALLQAKNIKIVAKEIAELIHKEGHLQHILFTDGTIHQLTAIFARGTMEHHTSVAQQLGCSLDENGYLTVNQFQETTVKGVYAAGDCTTMLRSVASAISTGNLAGVFANKDLINERF